MTDLHDFSTYCADVMVAGAGAGLIAALEHVSMWPITQHMDPSDPLLPLLPYVIGTATIGAGLTGLAIKWRDPRLAVASWGVIGSVGAVVAGLRLYRKWLSLEAGIHINKGYGAGHVAGARSYASEYQERRTPQGVA